MDRDTEPPESPKYHAIAEKLRRRVNCTAWTTERKELENYIHPNVIKDRYPAYSSTGQAFEDVPTLFARAVHEASESSLPWEDVIADQEKFAKKVSKAKSRLFNEFAPRMTPGLLSEIDPRNEVRTWLKTIGEALKAR